MSGSLLALLLLCGPAPASEQALGLTRQLYGEGRWAQIVEVWHACSRPPAELDYYAGMALARLGRFEEARVALESGGSKDPRDKRFPIELAGLAFKRQDYSSAATYLTRALRLDPGDSYANDFLATIYFLRQNLEAALTYWNRTGKPHIEQIRMEPEPEVRAALLDRGFAARPASILELRDLYATEASLDSLGVFSSYQFALAPREENGQFDLVFRSSERNGWGDKWQGLISMLRGASYATIYPEWYNLGRSAVNVTSLVRFDPEKLRLYAAAEIPAGGNPHLRWRLFFDGRKENWDLSRSFHGAWAAPTDLFLEKFEGGAEIRAVAGDSWGWSSTVSVADRRFARAPVAGAYFTDGLSVKYRGEIDRILWRVPEKRITVNSSGFGEFGKLLGHGLDPYSRVGASVIARWLPQSQGDRYEVSAGARAATSFGAPPFDELFMLGLERDNDLPLRAHIGTYQGRKGSAPLGRRYFLWNSDLDRTIYNAGVFKIKLGPFVDSGRITDSSGIFSENRWLWDTGAQLKLSLFSAVTVAFSYGKDLRSGRNAFYVTALRQ